MSGKLYLIGTPIGNMEDVSLRALRVLGEVEILVCEDSRVASKLVNHYFDLGMIKNKPEYFAYNEYNEDRVFARVVEWLVQGKIIGLVSDAGMPTISDPGYRIIRAVIDGGIELEIIPGPTAVTTALAWSGLGGEITMFLGFLPKSTGKSRALLKVVKENRERVKSLKIVLYVSPHKLLKELALIKEELGEVRCVLVREMTKMHQERIAGTVGEIQENFAKRKPKGEMVLVIN